MANLTVKQSGTPSTATQPSLWDPMRMVRSLLRWDPFSEMMPTLPSLEATGFVPAFEIKETKQGYEFRADLPGIEEKDVEITAAANRLTFTGKRETGHIDDGETYYAAERSYGSFVRSFTLPDDADVEHVRAELKNGVLSVIVPKTAEAQARKIKINDAGAKH